MGDSGNIMSYIWGVIMLLIFVPVISSIVSVGILRAKRGIAIQALERKFNCRIITLIHRQESLGLFGFKLLRYINLEDMEEIVQAIYLTSPKVPIYVIIHTPGGLVLAAEQIARALNSHRGKTKVFVPYYSMSGGTLIGLAADEVVMMPNAVLGPVDPQLPFGFLGSESLPAASIVKTLKEPNPHREDKFLALGDISQKALVQVEETVATLLKSKVDESKRGGLAKTLSQGTWTHDYPLTYERAKGLGLPVSNAFPLEIMRFMRLYPQPSGASSVRYVKDPYGR